MGRREALRHSRSALSTTVTFQKQEQDSKPGRKRSQKVQKPGERKKELPATQKVDSWAGKQKKKNPKQPTRILPVLRSQAFLKWNH